MANERWRSKAARDLVKAIRQAGGDVERTGVGKLKVTGPTGSTTLFEPSSGTRRDLRRSGAEKKIEEATGLKLGDD